MDKRSRRLSVLLADDHPVVRAGLKSMIDAQPDMVTVAEAADGSEAVELFRKHAPAITLMDLRMPVMDGVQAIEGIRKEAPEACILVLTTYDGDEDIHRALQAGARTYLLKDMSRDELLATIRAAHAGQHRIPPAVAARLAERVYNAELTTRETEVVERIAEGSSNKQVAAALGISEGTVKTHLRIIMSKMGVSDRTHVVTVALKRGIIHLR